METKNKAKEIFVQELASYLNLFDSKTAASKEGPAATEIATLQALTHKMKGGAGMLQLMDIRQCLTDIQVALSAGSSCQASLAELKKLHDKLS